MPINLKKKVSSVLLILVVAAAAELLTNVVLGRNLSPYSFGRFKFINTVVIMVSTLLLFGQNASIIRTLSKDDFAKYNWRKFINSCLLFSSFIGIIAVLSIGYFYKLYKETIFVYIGLMCAIGIEYSSSLLRSRNSYAYAMFFSKLSSISFFAIIAVILYVVRTTDLYLILTGYALAFLLTFSIGISSTRKFENGKEEFPISTIKAGLILFLITASFTIMTQIDQFFIAKMLGYDKLAHYTVIITITRGFDLIATSLWFVLMPHYAKDYSRSIKTDSIKVTLIGILVSIFYLFFGGFLLHFLFKGKFDSSFYLIKFFIIIGFARVVYSIPSGIIGGRLKSRYLGIFLISCLAGILINIAGNYFLIPRFGLNGSAFSTMASWIFRVLAAYLVVALEKKQSKAALANNLPWENV
ncbi:MAG: oligosaccharide flippase family protein [Candidatus Omnitrophota bacterium]|nr:oligosaccharide flippase family protein [Candidatus Omnitrophota bacterium]